MDLGEYWQENKRFVTSVALGLVGFLVAASVIDSTFADDIGATSRRVSRLKSDLAKPMFDATDLAAVTAENEALREAVGRLEEATAFVPRDGFSVDAGLGSPSNQYLRTLAEVREELLPRVNRANVRVDPGVGMPELSPTRGDEILRYLEALDVVETVVRMVVDSGVRRIDDIQVKLDPGLSSRSGLGRVERTRVVFELAGPSRSVTNLLARTQRPPSGNALLLEDVELIPARNKEDEVRLEMTVVIARLHEDAQQEVE